MKAEIFGFLGSGFTEDKTEWQKERKWRQLWKL